MNFKSILSKNSLSSSVSRQSSYQSEEIYKLQNEIEILRQNVSALKLLLESRETAIGVLAREKKNIYLDLKKVQRINKKIEQQLLDERKMNSDHKYCFLDATKQIPDGSEKSDTSCRVEDQYIRELKKEIKSKDQVIISVCNKYLKLKKCKRVIQDKFKTLQRNCGEVCENVLKALREHRDSVDLLLDDLIKNTTTSPSQEEYIKLVKMNNDLQFENTQLKLYQISNIYLAEGRDSSRASSQNMQKKIEKNLEEPQQQNSKQIRRPGIHYPLNILTISKSHLTFNGFPDANNLRKSISDSDLHRHFYI